MAPSPVPGWYDDPQSPERVRWWDGSRWTEHQNVKSAAQPAAPAPQAAQPAAITPPAVVPGGVGVTADLTAPSAQQASTPPDPSVLASSGPAEPVASARPAPRRRWLIPVAVGVGGLVLGIVIGNVTAGGPTAAEVRGSSQYVALDGEVKKAKEELESTGSELSAAKESLATATKKEAEFAQRTKDLDKRERAVAAKENPSSSPSPTWPKDEAMFLLDLRMSVDVDDVPDADLIALGKKACAALDGGASVTKAISELFTGDLTAEASGAVLGAAATDLCPAHASKLDEFTKDLGIS